jgi:hypothetical protein
VPVIENILPHLGLQARVPPRARGKMTGSFAAWNQCWRRSAKGRGLTADAQISSP